MFCIIYKYSLMNLNSSLSQRSSYHRSRISTTKQLSLIDLTNHDEVIHNLELKSKDLYYFWRNYQWLYNRYYAQLQKQEVQKTEVVKIKDNHDKCNRQIEELQGENDRLTKENKKLRLQLDTLRKKIQDSQGNDRFEQDYKKELTRLKNKCTQYQTIKQNLLGQVNKLKNTIRGNEDSFDEQRAKWNRENKKNTQTIIELQQTIDQMRSRATGPHARQGASSLQIQEMNRRQTLKIKSYLQDLQLRTQKLVAGQLESVGSQLQQNLQFMLSKLSASELQSILVEVQQ